jgi:ATP adenylyltransferase
MRGGIKAVANEQLWAPWRLGYIMGERTISQPCNAHDLLPGADPECFLCQAAPTAGDDRQRMIVERGVHTVTLLNRYPYNNGHLLVAPLRHVARLDELDDAMQLELTQTITRMVGVLEKVMQPQGFNVGLNLGRAAGAGVPGHVHWHIVPRWIGDTNFMPTIAGVHTIPQSLEALWELLAEELKK